MDKTYFFFKFHIKTVLQVMPIYVTFNLILVLWLPDQRST